MVSHVTFAENLKGSMVAVNAVAEHVARHGFDVVVPELYIPDSYEDGISDSGDIVASMGGVEFVIEVKGHPSLEWGDLSWCVYGLLIDKCKVFDAKVRRPDVYYILDRHLKVARTFRVSDWDKTYRRFIRDKVTGRQENCYMADPKHFSVVEL
jgi:hypothetical protein